MQIEPTRKEDLPKFSDSRQIEASGDRSARMPDHGMLPRRRNTVMRAVTMVKPAAVSGNRANTAHS